MRYPVTPRLWYRYEAWLGGKFSFNVLNPFSQIGLINAFNRLFNVKIVFFLFALVLGKLFFHIKPSHLIPHANQKKFIQYCDSKYFLQNVRVDAKILFKIFWKNLALGMNYSDKVFEWSFFLNFLQFSDVFLGEN